MIKRKDLEVLCEQRGERITELEREVEMLRAAVNEHEATEATLNKRLDDYRDREQLIATAVTTAVEQKESIIAQANSQADSIIKKANTELDAARRLIQGERAKAQADINSVIETGKKSVENAQKEAARIEQNARDSVKKEVDRQKTALTHYEANMKGAYSAINAELSSMTARLLEFLKIINPEFSEAALNERVNDYLNRSDNVDSPATYPDEYLTPAEVFHSVMSISRKEGERDRLLRNSDSCCESVSIPSTVKNSVENAVDEFDFTPDVGNIEPVIGFLKPYDDKLNKQTDEQKADAQEAKPVENVDDAAPKETCNNADSAKKANKNVFKENAAPAMKQPVPSVKPKPIVEVDVKSASEQNVAVNQAKAPNTANTVKAQVAHTAEKVESTLNKSTASCVRQGIDSAGCDDAYTDDDVELVTVKDICKAMLDDE